MQPPRARSSPPHPPRREAPVLLLRYPRRALACVAAVAAVAVLAVTACRPAAPAFGASRGEARANSDAFFGGLAARFTNVQRTPKFAAARSRLGRHALSPSKLMGDTSVWTGGGGAVRSLTLRGTAGTNRYVFHADPAAGVPVRPGDSRHAMRLRRLGDEHFEWLTVVDQAAGPATPEQLVDVWRALLATAVRTPGPALRAEYRLAVPRTTRAMGELMTLDTLLVRPMGDGSALLHLSVSLQPERLAARHPHFARYLVKYVQPARYAWTFGDRRGVPWIVADARRNRLTFRLRATADGRLAPLEGPLRPLPDTLVMRGEAYARFSIFTVGVSRLEATVAMLDTPQEQGWDFRFGREPDWHFPLAVNHLIRSALRRPFADEGAQLRLALQRRADGQTVIARRARVQVQEGAIVRWLGGLGAGAMDEFSGRAEEDENRFLAELFVALREDFAALLPATGAAAGAP